MASEGQPRLAGVALRALASAATLPVVGGPVIEGVIRNVGLDAFDIPELKDPALPPAVMPRPIRKAGGR